MKSDKPVLKKIFDKPKNDIIKKKDEKMKKDLVQVSNNKVINARTV